MHVITALTIKPLDFVKEKKMFGLSKYESVSLSEDSSIAKAIDGGADADRAIKGTSVRALSPPMLLKAVLKFEPLNIIVQ